jgi:hypothetical protein
VLSVEVLAAYSHTKHLGDLRRCLQAQLAITAPSPTPSPGRPWSLRNRLDERVRGELIDAYRAGATAASLASAHRLSLRSVKRLVAAAGVRRTPLSM